MSDLDPIELEFKVNSPEFMEEFRKMMSGVKQFDSTTNKASDSFSNFLTEQLKALDVLDSNAKLSEKQAKAIQRHAETLDWLKERLANTYDPTQLAVYEKQVQDIGIALQKIAETANKNVNLMDSAEIDAANTKLNEAVAIMDKISDAAITPSFASPEELDQLSEAINSTDDAMQQLGFVIDFVQGKLSEMDTSTEEFKQLQADIEAANSLLGRTPQLYDATGNSINQMSDALKIFQEQLSSETNPENIKILNQKIETLENGIQQLKNAGKTGFDEFGNKIVEQKEHTVSLQTELENLVNKMAQLRLANQEGSEEYETLRDKAIETRTAISATNNEINTGVKNTANLQGLINITQNIAAGYGLINGAIGLLNDNSEESEKIIEKVTSVLAVLQSLQQIQVALNTRDAATTSLLTTAKNMFAAASLRVAAALGISQLAAQALMATLTLGLSVAVVAVIVALEKLSAQQKEQQELNKKTADSLAEPMLAYKKLREEWNALGNDLEAKKKFISENTSEFDKLGVSVTDVSQAENIFVKNTGQMEAALMARAKAAAAMELATESYKKALEKQLQYEDETNTMKNGSFIQQEKLMLQQRYRITPLATQIYEDKKKADALIKKAIGHQEEEKKKLSQLGVNQSSTKFEYSATIKAEEHKLKVAKERYGKADKMELDFLNKKLRYAQNNKDEYEKVLQEIELFQARSLKSQDDEAKRSSEKQLNEQKSAATKAQKLAEQALQKRQAMEVKIAEEIAQLSTKQNEGNELASITAKWDNLKNEAVKLGISKKLLEKIDKAKEEETGIVKYQNETKELLKNLEQQKELFSVYEALKTSISQEEAEKRSGINLQEFTSFSDNLNHEIEKLEQNQQRSFQENERLKALQAMKSDYDVDKNKSSTDKFAQAYQDTLTHQEKIQNINTVFSEKAIQLQSITDTTLRNNKLAENERQRQDAINAANREAYDKATIYEQMSQNLIGITKQELAVRIASLEEYLVKTKDSLKKEELDFIQSEIAKAKAIQSSTNIGVYENALLKEKNRLLDEIKNKKLEGIIDPNDINALERINQELKKLVAQKAKLFAEDAGKLASGFKEMASAIGDSNEGLADTLDTLGDVLGIAQSAGNAFASFASGDIIGGITGIFSTISGIFSLGKKARESEKKAREEMKKYQDEIFQAQLDYNAELRKRIADEIKLNDLYKSRIDNIKEEIEANKKNSELVIKDQKEVWERLLKARTVTGMHTEKYGGFLGIGKKTKTVEEYSSVAELLGLGTYKTVKPTTLNEQLKLLAQGGKMVKGGIQIFEPAQVELTDEIFDKLEKMNSIKPLTGDAKQAYDQLKKLRDEYGSLEEANRQLEIQLKNVLTGTTAQSLADSIREGLKSGRKTFADFADDIEGFLRDAILAGISAKMIEPKIQELQDALADMMGDGILSADERAQFQDMYMKIVESSNEYMDVINQAGVNMSAGAANANSLQGAFKAMNQESADIMSGQLGGMRLAQLDTNSILKNGFSQQLELSSKMVQLQLDIEKNTRRTAENTEKLYDVDNKLGEIKTVNQQQYLALQAAGII